MTYYLAVLAGGIVGKMYDPVTWGYCALLLLLAFSRFGRWWHVPVLALAATILNIVLVYDWWLQLGIADQWPQRGLRLFWIFTTIGIIAYGIATGTAKLLQTKRLPKATD